VMLFPQVSGNVKIMILSRQHEIRNLTVYAWVSLIQCIAGVLSNQYQFLVGKCSCEVHERI
jgi:hypothetical protein